MKDTGVKNKGLMFILLITWMLVTRGLVFGGTNTCDSASFLEVSLELGATYEYQNFVLNEDCWRRLREVYDNIEDMVDAGQFDGVNSSLLAKAYSQIGWYRYNGILNKAYPEPKKIELLKYFEKAIELDGENATYYFQRGMTKALYGDVQEGLADIRKSVSLDDSFPEAYFWMCMNPFRPRLSEQELERAGAGYQDVQSFRPCLNYFDKGYPAQLSIIYVSTANGMEELKREVSHAFADRFRERVR